VAKIVQQGYESATGVLTQHRAVLDRLAVELLEHESLDGEVVYELIRDMTGQDHAPTRPAPPGEGLYIGQEGPETVATAPVPVIANGPAQQEQPA
jgi:hypothetical protein